MINKKFQVWLPLLFSITMIAGMYIGYKMRDNMPGKSFFYTGKRKPVEEIIDLIQHKYVDEVKTEELADTAIQAMLSKLDPHSVLIQAGQLQLANEDLAGKFFGIGIEFNIFGDTLNVISVIKAGPGEKAGLMTGDKFLKVGDSILTGKKMMADHYRKLLRGDRGTQVQITFLRDGIQKQVILTRDAITMSSVDAGYMMDGGTGYIRLNKFSSQTYREFMETLESLKKQGLLKLILDLRGNGGGILEEAVEIADEFLEGDKLITYTEGKHAEKKEYRCRREGQFEKGPLVVLADEGTASASEVLIGALQDWDRAIVIGRRTFGKGLVQEQFDLSDHSALRLTIARYYTPSGRNIQRPYSSGEKVYYEEIINRFHDGETQSMDSVKNDTSKVYKTRLGKKIYGGGGISPDFFVPQDTSLHNPVEAKLFVKGTIQSFAYQYYLQHRQELSRFRSAKEFKDHFALADQDWHQFGILAAKDSIYTTKINNTGKTYLMGMLKANIARLIWRMEGYFEISNTIDDFIKMSQKVMEK